MYVLVDKSRDRKQSCSVDVVVQLIMVFILLVVGTFLNNSAAMVLLPPIFTPLS